MFPSLVSMLHCNFILFYSFAVCICDSIVQNHKLEKSARYAMYSVCKNLKNRVKQISKCRYSGLLSFEQKLRKSFNAISHYMIVTKMTTLLEV